MGREDQSVKGSERICPQKAGLKDSEGGSPSTLLALLSFTHPPTFLPGFPFSALGLASSWGLSCPAGLLLFLPSPLLCYFQSSFGDPHHQEEKRGQKRVDGTP